MKQNNINLKELTNYLFIHTKGKDQSTAVQSRFGLAYGVWRHIQRYFVTGIAVLSNMFNNIIYFIHLLDTNNNPKVQALCGVSLLHPLQIIQGYHHNCMGKNIQTKDIFNQISNSVNFYIKWCYLNTLIQRFYVFFAYFMRSSCCIHIVFDILINKKMHLMSIDYTILSR